MERNAAIEKSESAAARLSVLAGDYWEFHLREHPYVAQDLGDARYRRELFKESAGDYARRDDEHAVFSGRLAAISVSELSGQDRFTYRLLERELGEARISFALRSHLRPWLFPMGPEGLVDYTNNKTVVSGRADAEDFVARMETVPALFDHFRERLLAGVEAGYRMPAVLLEGVCKNAESFLAAPLEQSTWYKPLAMPAGGDDSAYTAARAALRALIELKIQPAYRRWLEWLRGDYKRQCRDSIGSRDEPQGEAYYRFLVRNQTTSTLSAEEIHALGLEEVKRIRAEMETAAARAGYAGDLAGLRKFLSSDPRFIAKSKEELKEKIEILTKRIDRRMPEFFGRLPRMTYGVESIPEARAAQMPPAYAQPNPASGALSGVFWLTSLPQRCPSYMHVPLTMHEAWPGHLMHIALLQEMTELPAFRRYNYMGYTAYIEGWALYCERLGHELGFYQDPHAHYGALEMEIWRAVRLVVDTGIHLMNWTRDRAIAYMAEHLSLARAVIEAEVDRYIGIPGQALAYKVGELKIRELRQRASRTLGEKFSLRALHDRLIDAGPVTMNLLDEHVQEWIDASLPRAA